MTTKKNSGSKNSPSSEICNKTESEKRQQNGGERETGRRRGNHTPFGPAVAGLALTAAVHARDAMAAGALVNHPLPERNITPGRLLKIADRTVGG